MKDEEESEDESENEAEDTEKTQMEDAANPDDAADAKVSSMIGQIEKLLQDLKKAQSADEGQMEAEETYAPVVGKETKTRVAVEPGTSEPAEVPEADKAPGHEDQEPVKQTYEEALEQLGYVAMENEELKAELASLRAFKAEVEAKDKEVMMEKFSNLDAGFLADVKKNINSYSLSELEAKLSIEAVRSGTVLKSISKVKSYSVDLNADSDTPSWLSALMEKK
jgi:hypothetical protein